MTRPVTFGVIVSTRGFFPAWLAEQGRKDVLARLETMGHNVVIVPEDATPHGAIETLSDAKVCARVFAEHRDDIEGIIVCLPNFGDEVGVAEAISRSGLNVPILVHASDDRTDALDMKHRRDAFCGKLSVCNNLYQRGHRITPTRLHSCAIDSDAFAGDVDFFARVCRVVRGLRTCRLGAIGQRPNPFNTVRYSEKLLQAAGISVQAVDLSEIIAAATALPSGGPVDERVKEIRAYGRIPEAIPPEHIERSAKLSLVIEQWVEDNEVDATAVQCWSSIQANYGCATCLPMSLMGQAGKPSACETDVTGVLTMYAMQLAAGAPSGYLDWNNNYDDDRDACICLHCSNFPKGFIGRDDLEIGNLDILGESLGPENCFGGIKARVAPGPMTFGKISTDDTRGVIKAYVGEGEFLDAPVETAGGVAVCRVKGLQKLMRHLSRNGFEHHVAMNRGHVAAVLAEAMGGYLGWDVHVHEA